MKLITMGANPGDMSPAFWVAVALFSVPPLSVQNNCNIFHIACCIKPAYAILTPICIKFRWEGLTELTTLAISSAKFRRLNRCAFDVKFQLRAAHFYQHICALANHELV